MTLDQQLKWSLIQVLVALRIHQVTENFQSRPSTIRVHKKASMAKNPLNRSRRCCNARIFSCSLCSLRKWASLHLRKICCILLWMRPCHSAVETETFVKWTRVLSSLETVVSRSQHCMYGIFASSCILNNLDTCCSIAYDHHLCSFLLLAVAGWKRWSVINKYSNETSAWLNAMLFATMTSQTFQGMAAG